VVEVKLETNATRGLSMKFASECSQNGHLGFRNARLIPSISIATRCLSEELTAHFLLGERANRALQKSEV